MPQHGQQRSVRALCLVALGATLAAAQVGCTDAASGPLVNHGPPEIALGKRLFRETRFAQYFAARAEGDMNRRLSDGDPTVASIATPAGAVESPYRGQSINCATCHLSDELVAERRVDKRAFADFTRRSLLPAREDGRETTTRNAASLLDALTPSGVNLFLHHDGQHASAEELVQSSLTGRNFGWLPIERAQAVAHIASVLRRDEGAGKLAVEFGGLSYRVAFAGTAASIPPELRLPDEFRVEVTSSTDDELLAAIAKLVTAYVRHQRLARDEDGLYSGSPYDRFLRKNNLPAQPTPGETVEDYGRRLYTQVVNLQAPAFVDAADGRFEHQDQTFVFGPTELAGLVTFLGKPGEVPTGPPGTWACSTCHPPPDFSDFRFHNTGVTEFEYDSIHGAGSFTALAIPTLEERRMNEAAFLPPSPRIPEGSSVFRAVPAKEHPGRTDLGLWNVLLNEDAPAVQPALQGMLCPLVLDAQGNCNPEDVLTRGIAAFKTRGLRDLGHSGPYFHNGMANTLEDVVIHYLRAALAAKNAQLRNGDVALEWLSFSSSDIPALAAFLRSLNAD